MHPSFVCVVVSTGMGSKTLHQQNPPVPNYVYFVDHYHRVWQCCNHPFTSCAALRAWALQGFMTLTFDLLTIELYRLTYQCTMCELSTCISVLIASLHGTDRVSCVCVCVSLCVFTATAHSELFKVLFLALSVTFVCVWNISGTGELICDKFTWKTCLVPRSDEFEGQGQSLKGQGHQRQQELIRRWDSKRELLRSTPRRYANSLK